VQSDQSDSSGTGNVIEDIGVYRLFKEIHRLFKEIHR
jgi:hypothetical protein